MEGGNFGYSRDYLDRFIQSQDSSVVNKFQQKYWKTKQTLIKVTGKKEDEHVVASDADLDGKLEVFHSIQRTCMELLKVIEQYQRRICFLSQEENELGRFLRSQGSQDKTRAGKIMQATGKALCFSSQQRVALRNPLCRLYQEVETFRYRAISDTWLTVNRMEQSRTEYRGALLWMKDVSQELDPDTHKQMEKFRKTTLLHFWEKTSHTMAAIHESFKGSQHYEFSTLKTLKDPVDKLVRKKGKKKSRVETEDGKKSETTDNQLISLESETTSDRMDEEPESSCPRPPPLSSCPELEGEEDSMALLNEILGSLSVDEGDFSREWTEVFGDTEDGTSAAASGRPADAQQRENSFFLPSHLLDQSLNNLHSSLSDWADTAPAPVAQTTEPSSGANQNAPKPAVKGKVATSKDLSAWFNLFADLDPLSNPDAVGKTDSAHELHTA
nr:PREDICTED: islet cell autoantigen 1 isoform X2 [Paralichthys olivaceus]